MYMYEVNLNNIYKSYLYTYEVDTHILPQLPYGPHGRTILWGTMRLEGPPENFHYYTNI